MNTRGNPTRAADYTESTMKGDFEIFDAKFARDRPRRFSNLGIDFLDDPDQRPDSQGTYHAHHAESYHGDKEHRNSDLESKK